VEKLNKFLWPINLRYYSTLCPIFLHEIQAISHFSFSNTWLIRDGLIPLIWFFKNNPKPLKSWKSRILIHVDLIFCVPPAWIGVVGVYKLLSEEKKGSKSGILLLGLVLHEYCSLRTLDSLLSVINANREFNLVSESSLRALLVVKTDSALEAENSHFHAQYFLKLFEYFGQSIEILGWPQFQKIGSFEKFRVIDLNDQKLCADNYLIHHALSRGASVFRALSPKVGLSFERAEYYPLSPFHGFKVISDVHCYIDNTKYWKGFLNIVKMSKGLGYPSKSNSDQLFPWPKWIQDWASTC
jgi:hypothetical protein